MSTANPCLASRADFPALETRVHGKPLAYLDNAASVQKPKQVLDRMREAYEHEYANVHRGLHHLADLATKNYEDARAKVQNFINAAHADEVIFTKNATESFNLVASSFGQGLKEGDEIVLSIMEHHSNIVPWHYLREKTGCVIKWVPVDESGNFLIEAFERTLSAKTKIVSITQMSNALGTIVPIKKVIGLAHERDIPVVVDGTQAVVHLDVDVQDLGADFYVFTGHKLYGPTGIGVLYGKKAWLERLPPFLGGGEMIKTVTQNTVSYAAPPMRFEAGTPPIVQAVGLGAAIDYMTHIGKTSIRQHEDELLKYATENIINIKGLRIFGEANHKSAILSFGLEGVHPHDISTVLDRAGVAVRAGTHCTMPLLERFGVSATCRASLALYNRKSDIDQLIEGLEKAKELFR